MNYLDLTQLPRQSYQDMSEYLTRYFDEIFQMYDPAMFMQSYSDKYQLLMEHLGIHAVLKYDEEQIE